MRACKVLPSFVSGFAEPYGAWDVQRRPQEPCISLSTVPDGAGHAAAARPAAEPLCPAGRLRCAPAAPAAAPAAHPLPTDRPHPRPHRKPAQPAGKPRVWPRCRALTTAVCGQLRGGQRRVRTRVSSLCAQMVAAVHNDPRGFYLTQGDVKHPLTASRALVQVSLRSSTYTGGSTASAEGARVMVVR